MYGMWEYHIVCKLTPVAEVLEYKVLEYKVFEYKVYKT